MHGCGTVAHLLSQFQRAPRDPGPAKRWLAFLGNHREAIAAMDLFTVPAITFGVLYCFFIIGHDRRRIVNFNVPSDRRLDHPAVARGLPVSIGSSVPHL